MARRGGEGGRQVDDAHADVSVQPIERHVLRAASLGVGDQHRDRAGPATAIDDLPQVSSRHLGDVVQRAHGSRLERAQHLALRRADCGLGQAPLHQLDGEGATALVQRQQQSRLVAIGNERLHDAARRQGGIRNPEVAVAVAQQDPPQRRIVARLKQCPLDGFGGAFGLPDPELLVGEHRPDRGALWIDLGALPGSFEAFLVRVHRAQRVHERLGGRSVGLPGEVPPQRLDLSWAACSCALFISAPTNHARCTGALP